MEKIVIVGDKAHFKIPNGGENQLTYEIPPISTVVGILQNIYNKDINDFLVGYKIEYSSKEKEITKIYKEVNINDDLKNPKRFTNAICYVENLTNVRLVIYTDILDKIELNECLTLGKAGYLANLNIKHNYDLIDKEGIAYNQYSPISMGYGRILRIKTLTKYNGLKGYYDYWSTLVRQNNEVEYSKFYDEEEEENIIMWKWKDGEVSAV